ncbi:PH domain-containing protein [Dermabacteraceae bacterium P13095]
MKLVGLPRRVAFYESFRGLIGLAIMLGVLEFVRRLDSVGDAWPTIIRILQVLALIIGLIEFVVMNRRLLKFTTISVNDGVLELNRGRWLNISNATRLLLVISAEVIEGPFLRALGLAKLELRSVGRVPEIPALPIDTARKLQYLIVTYKPDSSLRTQEEGVRTP